MRIALVATGGTIASRNKAGDGVVAEVSGAELLASLPAGELPDGADIAPVDAGTRGSYNLTLEDMRGIADEVFAQLRTGADAVVVTHGTDSLEETAFLLDLLHAGDEAIVVTGAQRSFDSDSSDGPANLADALHVAATADQRGRGVLVAFGGRVMPARGVRKVDTTDLVAFVAPDTAPSRSTLTSSASLGTLPDIAVVAAAPGGDGTAVRDALRHRPAGLVFQAVGAGNASEADAEAVAQVVAAGVPVLITTRVMRGAAAPIYGNGGGLALQRAGALFASDLTTWQARVLLSVAAAQHSRSARDAVRDWLDKHG